MKAFLLLLFVPRLVVSDTQCPDSNISCPDDKRCCEVDGQHTCCDLDDDVGDVHVLEGKMKVYGGVELLQQAEQYPNASISVQNGPFSNCNFLTCSKGVCCNGKCCSPGKWTCCPDNKCCHPQFRCCPGGCCPKKQECCGTGCCADGERCCGSWCCKKKSQCGASYFTCYGKGVSFTPAITTVLLLAAAAVMSRPICSIL